MKPFSLVILEELYGEQILIELQALIEQADKLDHLYLLSIESLLGTQKLFQLSLNTLFYLLTCRSSQD